MSAPTEERMRTIVRDALSQEMMPTLRPIIAFVRDVHDAVTDDTLDDAALGRRVRQIAAESRVQPLPEQPA